MGLSGGKWECMAWRGEGWKTPGPWPLCACWARGCSHWVQLRGGRAFWVGSWGGVAPGSELHAAGSVRATSGVDSLRMCCCNFISFPPECSDAPATSHIIPLLLSPRLPRRSLSYRDSRDEFLIGHSHGDTWYLFVACCISGEP